MKLTLEALMSEIQKMQDAINDENTTAAEKFMCCEMIESMGTAIYETAHELKKDHLQQALQDLSIDKDK